MTITEDELRDWARDTLPDGAMGRLVAEVRRLRDENERAQGWLREVTEAVEDGYIACRRSEFYRLRRIEDAARRFLASVSEHATGAFEAQADHSAAGGDAK